jgi:type III restriction enzyme
VGYWEKTVLETELSRESFVGWYRNPSRAMANSLRIAYLNDVGKWSSVQVDFLVISRRDDGSLIVSIVDPHGDHLADAKGKLRALASFAETHGERFLRIESIAKASNGVLRSLDLQDPATREAVRLFEGGKVTALYESTVADTFQ